MSDTLTYACTTVVVTLPDHTKVTYQAGQIVRPKLYPSAFSDCIILGFSDPTKHGDIYVKVGRPYAYASCIGTTGPSVLTGVETFGMTMNQLLGYERVGEETRVSLGSPAPIERPYADEHLAYTARMAL